MKLLLDTCVLYPTGMREMLLGAARAGHFVPLWSARILGEWERAAVKLGPTGAAQAKAEELGLLSPVVGHVGDGNFHTLPLIDTSNPDEVARAEEYVSWLNDLAISMDGTCTGEHGIGQGKRPYLERELGPAVKYMAAIKAALDPDNIMNPGKIVPA